jgi:hypothetical protein
MQSSQPYSFASQRFTGLLCKLGNFNSGLLFLIEKVSDK